jgi:hypothetical protein
MFSGRVSAFRLQQQRGHVFVPVAAAGVKKSKTEYTRTSMNKKPNITITSLDAERLEILLDSLPKGGFPGKADLEEELDRATIVEPKMFRPPW